MTQIHRDFQRALAWYQPAQFVTDILSGAVPALIAELGREMEALISAELLSPDLKALQICEQWDRFCHTLLHAYQDQAVVEVEG